MYELRHPENRIYHVPIAMQKRSRIWRADLPFGLGAEAREKRAVVAHQVANHHRSHRGEETGSIHHGSRESVVDYFSSTIS